MTDTDRIAGLERRLAVLEDKDEIRRLRDDYHGCINDGRFAEIVDLFTADAHVELGYLATYVGRDAIDVGFRGMGARERFYIKQFIHSHRINVRGDDGTGVSYLEARYGRFGTSYLVSGKYDDIYRRVDGKWLFSSMIAEFYYTVPDGVGWTGDELHYLKPK
jgi:hypothetical protein